MALMNFVSGTTITSDWLNSIDTSASGSCSVFDYLTSAQVTDVLAYTYTNDLTSAINTAYAAAASLHKQLRFPAGGYRITSTLAWNQSVDIIGQSSEFTIIKKDTSGGDFIGILISGSAQQSRFQDFTLLCTGTVDPAIDGIKVTASARMLMQRLQSTGHGRHGFAFIDTGVNGMGVFSRYMDLVGNNNGGDAVRMEFQYASRLTGLNASGNGGYGYYNTHGNSTQATDLVCESNTLGGSRTDTCVANILQCYGEANTGADIQLTANSVRNWVVAYHEDAVSDMSDEGTNNVVLDIGLFPMFSCPTIGRIPRTSNTVGRDLRVAAGTAGPGAAGHAGGALTITSGDAAGGTIARGGTATLGAGEGVHGARGGDVNVVGGTGDSGAGYGDIFITNAKMISVDPAGTGSQLELANSGSPISVAGSGAVIASVCMDFQSKKAIQLPRMTTTEINALSTTDGEAMFAYNQTLHCPVFFDGTIWQRLSFTAM